MRPLERLRKSNTKENLWIYILFLLKKKEVYGWENNITNELCWTANTSEGRLIFAWDYKLKEWSIYDFAADFIMAGKGTISEST